jgi:cell wall-associated NlpC family hydrolase
LRAGAAIAGVAVCSAVAVFAATGTFSGGTSHAKLTAEQRHHLAAVRAATEAARRAARFADERRVQAVQACGGARKVRNLPPERYGAAVGIAEKYLGVPYVWGGASPHGFDAPGLVTYVYKQLGVSLAHYTVSQYCYRKSVRVPRSKLKPGDLVFFSGLGHVGIYIGDNQFIHSPHTGAVVRIEGLTGAYSADFYGATRILH